MTTKTAEFIAIPAGQFIMGADAPPHPEDGESPPRPVLLGRYQISATAVSNAQFEAFAQATGYVTLAEQQGGSQVFAGQLADADAHPAPFAHTPWWRLVAGAHWRRPNGTQDARPDHPVVHIARHDALAYCAWSGTRLPTEAEWEHAAQDQTGIAPHIWRGSFPDAPEGKVEPKPVAAGQANAAGLYHACGNVWEWVNDRFARLHSPREVRDPQGPLNGADYVVKGGSFLCAPSYCARFHPSSRRGEVPTATASNLGFRVAR